MHAKRWIHALNKTIVSTLAMIFCENSIAHVDTCFSQGMRIQHRHAQLSKMTLDLPNSDNRHSKCSILPSHDDNSYQTALGLTPFCVTPFWNLGKARKMGDKDDNERRV